MDERCRPSSKPLDSELYSSLDIKWGPRLQSELCSLNLIGNFLKKLKENGTFSNSMVLIVSDHGVQEAHSPSNAKGLSQDQLRDGSLLLIKRFGDAEGELRISDHLTTNYDVPTFIKNSLGDKQEEPWKNKERKRSTVHGDWQRDLHPKAYFNLKEIYDVKGSMFEGKNWKKIGKF